MNLYQTTKLILFLLVPAVLIGLIFLVFTGQVGVYDSLYYISSPLFKISSAAAGWFKAADDFIFEFKSIRGEYARLKNENSELLSRLAISAEIKNENAVLKNQLGQKSGAPERKLVFAEIIGRSRSLNEKTIIINKGADAGVAENRPFVYGNFLVGRTVKVYANYSVAALIGDPSLKISAAAQNFRTQGVIFEKNGGLIFGEAPKDKILTVGDLAVTLGFDGLPKGLILGEITEVFNADNELFQSAAVKPLLDVFGLESGFIVID